MRRQTKKRVNKLRKSRKNVKRGGMMAYQGAEACIFKPVVACEDDSEKQLGLELDKYVSRIVPDSTDTAAERLIAEKFPELLDDGVVVAGKHFCKPKFNNLNIKAANDIEETIQSGNPVPCGTIQKAIAPSFQLSRRVAQKVLPQAFLSKVTKPSIENSFTNIITKEYNQGNLIDYYKKNNIKDPFKQLEIAKGAIYAALSLVPDEGPWIIHTDCHGANIFVHKKEDGSKVSALADWGQTIIIKDPEDSYEIIEKLEEYLDQQAALLKLNSLLKKSGLKRLDFDLLSLSTLVINGEQIKFGDFPQHSFEVLDRLKSYWNRSNDEAMNALRGWTTFAIFKLIWTLSDLKEEPDDADSIYELLQCTSQKDLFDYIQYITESLKEGKYRK